MKQAIMCLFRLHTYEVYKEESIVDVRNEEIGKFIIIRCKYCGRLKKYKYIYKSNY